MSVVVERGEGIECVLKGTLSDDVLKAKVRQKLQEIANKARIPGFRPGRVPANHIESLYGTSVRAEIIEQLTKSALEDAIKEHALMPLHVPEVNFDSKEQVPLTYTARFEVMPELDLTDLSKLTIKGCAADIKHEEVEDALTRVRAHFAQWKEIDRATKLGDRLTVDYMSLSAKPQEAQDDSLLKDQQLVLGQHQLPEAFDKYLVDKYQGDTVRVLLPQEGKGKNKEVHCTVVIKKTEEAILPELDTHFAKKLGMDVETKEAFYEEAKKPLERERDLLLQRLLQQRLYAELIAKNKKVPVSKSLFYNNIDRLAQQMSEEMKKEKRALQPGAKDPLARRAAEQAKLHLMMMKLQKTANITLDEQKLVAYIKDLASQYADPGKFLQWFQQDEKQLASAKATVLEQQIIDKVMEKITVKKGEQLASLANLRVLVQKEEV